jgi:hypothetical protein
MAAGMEASTITSLGTCRLVMPLSESTMARHGGFGGAQIGFDGAALGVRQVFWILAYTSPMPLRTFTPSLAKSRRIWRTRPEEGADGMAEQDGVGDLHHGGLQVQREQHALRFGIRDLGGKRRAGLLLMKVALDQLAILHL